MTEPGSTTSRRMLRGVGSLLALVAIIGGLPAALIAMGAYPTTVPSLLRIWDTLWEQDRGQLLFGVLAAGVWACWALFTVATVQEAIGSLRRKPAAKMRGLGGFQRPAAVLVAAVIALLVTLPPSTTATAAPLPNLTGTSQISLTQLTSDAVMTQAPPVSLEESPQASGPTYTVQRMDSLWRIAEQHLGDPLRYTEIITLNPGQVGPDNRLEVGTVLVLPTNATGLSDPAQIGSSATPTSAVPPRDVTVEAGESLSVIAQDELGDADAYPLLWEANASRVEPDGASFTDPDLIRPGWTITIPGAAAATPPLAPTAINPAAATPDPASAPATTEVTSAPSDDTLPSTDDPVPQPTDVPAAAERGSTASAGSVAAGEDSANRSVTSVLWEILGAGAALLAAGAWMALRSHRRRQFRHRRVGYTVNQLPPEVQPMEQVLNGLGAAAAERAMFMDTALRTLREAVPPSDTMPDLLAVRLSDQHLQLVLATHHPRPPAPWRVAGPARWVIDRTARLPEWEAPGDSTYFAPYACLVSLGYDDGGAEWLLDLEHLGALVVTGPADRSTSLLRYIAAELANNPWTDPVQVTMSGFGENLVAANPHRLSYAASPRRAVDVLTRSVQDKTEVLEGRGLRDAVEGRHLIVAADAWIPEILLAAPTNDPADLQRLRDLVELTTRGPRCAVAVMATNLTDQADGISPWTLRLQEDGSAHLDALALHLTAHQLPEWVAADLAVAINLAMIDRYDSPAGPAEGDRPVDAFATTLGSLRPEHTLPRTVQTIALADADATSSVLPQPVTRYLADSGATAEEVTSLGPVVSMSTRRRVENADPTLDEDLRAWHSADTTRPRLRVLGPVEVRGAGTYPSGTVPLLTEIVTYLALHPTGVTSDVLAMQLWPDSNYTGRSGHPRNMLQMARAWLGADDSNGHYLPHVDKSGHDTYRLTDTLLDADLFRRLRVRGEARGTDGLDDLRAALHLVSGVPFDGRRKLGWAWLSADRSYVYAGMVTDLAHTVATRALADDNYRVAREAIEVALSTDASDDRALLNQIAADIAEGHVASAKATVQRILINNDARVREDLPEATSEVLERLLGAIETG